jgi:hypothetical protein
VRRRHWSAPGRHGDELSAIADQLHTNTETDWPTLVADAEDSIAREHALWHTTRSTE